MQSSPHFNGPGPASLKYTQPVKVLLPRLKSITSQSFFLVWETFGSSQDRSYWPNMVRGSPAKPRPQHLQHSLIPQTDHSNTQAGELFGLILLKDPCPPLLPPSSLIHTE